MGKRKLVSWRVGDHHHNEILNKWLDGQLNIQESLSNVILHIYDHFGDRNITDYDVQKALYQGFSLNNPTPIPNQPVNSNPVIQEAPAVEPPVKNDSVNINETLVKKEEPIKYEESDNKEQSNNDPNDIYGQVDMNNL
ncbi:hypothetical protein [Priestia megaterium]|uniref:hypothetical protein n=1 Tax=Priestia megaterium TaxID=1404 RepID=UPI000BFDAEAB|nr:hypothetical protein [Priestia megaterium]PGQ88346.1 hypothetical protein COA18_05295 [Priestia megaterium]